MIITDPVYTRTAFLTPNTSALRIKTLVPRLDDCKVVIVSNYDVISAGFYEYFEHLVEYCSKTQKIVLYDSTTELVSEEFLQKCIRYEDLSCLTILTNGVTSEGKLYLEKLAHTGVKMEIRPFFVQYADYYSDIQTDKVLPQKKFLLLGGKPKPHRTAITGLLLSRGLQEFGYISYFGFSKNETFFQERYNTYFSSTAPTSQKEKVRNGFKGRQKNMVLDCTEFDNHVSHTRQYNSDYYRSVDFVIVTESDTSPDKVFITEKTTKCIQLNKPFILLSGPGMLSETKNAYRKYLNLDISNLTDWCSTSYDSIHNLWDRIEAIVDIVENECRN